MGCLETLVTVNCRSLWLLQRFQQCMRVYGISPSMTEKLRIDLRVSQLQTREPQSSEILSLVLSVVRPALYPQGLWIWLSWLCSKKVHPISNQELACICRTQIFLTRCLFVCFTIGSSKRGLGFSSQRKMYKHRWLFVRYLNSSYNEDLFSISSFSSGWTAPLTVYLDRHHFPRKCGHLQVGS